MTGRIFLLNEQAGLMAMDESAYDSEKLLQKLLADYPDLLAGEQIDSEKPRRWLLVAREMSIPDEADGSGRWALDHLFLDQDATPTLVEVKRSTDNRIRRSVVGQMLDYAANAVVYWPVEEIKAKFEARCTANGDDASEILSSHIDQDQDVAEFWQKVKINLQAGRIRMVFIADEIPAELRRIVEFLNEQMDPAEVLAIEIKQYVGSGMKTLVPRVIGQTETARQKKSAGAIPGKQWDEASFLKVVRESRGEAAERAAKVILDWVTPQVTYVWYGKGQEQGGIVPVISKGKTNYQLFRMATNGRFAFRFDWLYKKPPFDDESLRRQLLTRINELPGAAFTEEVLTKRARIPFESLSDATAMSKLKATVQWLIDTINTA